MVEVLREKDLCARLKVSRETLRKIRTVETGFPQRRRIFGDVRGWLSPEIDAWLQARPSEASK